MTTEMNIALTPEISAFLRRNAGSEPYSGLPMDYKEVDGKWRFVLVEDKISQYHIQRAVNDLAMIAERIEARKGLIEIEEGDVIEYLDGRKERVTHVWQGQSAQAGGGSGSYYMNNNGTASYSGGLNSGLPLDELELTDKTEEHSFWFFSGGCSGANRGVHFYCPVKVWRQKLPDYLFIGTFPNCYSYADKTREEKGDYKVIARVYFRPLEIQIFADQPEYQRAIALAKDEYWRIRENIDKPIQVSATGQTIQPYLK